MTADQYTAVLVPVLLAASALAVLAGCYRAALGPRLSRNRARREARRG